MFCDLCAANRLFWLSFLMLRVWSRYIQLSFFLHLCFLSLKLDFLINLSLHSQSSSFLRVTVYNMKRFILRWKKNIFSLLLNNSIKVINKKKWVQFIRQKTEPCYFSTTLTQKYAIYAVWLNFFSFRMNAIF